MSERGIRVSGGGGAGALLQKAFSPAGTLAPAAPAPLTPSAACSYPRGLTQPAGGLRFGLDALLLAAFVVRRLRAWPGRRGLAAVDLGCGCGAALLGLGLGSPRVWGLGLEREPALAAAAEENIARLGLTARMRARCLELEDVAALRALRGPEGQPLCARADVVLANPPYERAGRPSPDPLRERALRSDNGAALEVFCRAAGLLLRHKGHFFCCYDARALPRLCQALRAAGLGLRLALPVRARQTDPAWLVLAAAQKGAADDLRLEAPLTLHRGPAPTKQGPAAGRGADARAGCSGTGSEASGPAWTAAARRFCPWLDRQGDLG